MTTSLEVLNVWREQVFEDARIAIVTEAIVPMEVSAQSEVNEALLYFQKKMNFFEIEVSRSDGVPIEIGGDPEYTFKVEIRYNRELGEDGQDEIAVRSTIEAVCDIAREVLGDSWGSLGMAQRSSNVEENVAERSVNDTPLLTQVVRFIAVKQF